MSSIKHSILVLAGAGFVAATLQGSRLPEEALPEAAVVAWQASLPAHRPGPGPGRGGDPPIREGNCFA